MVKDSTQFRQRFNRWKNGAKVYDAGKPVEDDYEKFKQTLPPNQRNTSEYEYSTRRYWELNGKPKNFNEAVKRKMYTLENDGFYHASSIAWTPDGDAEFMKPNVHPTKHFEDEFYESNPEFQKEYRRTLDWTRPGFSKYERNINPLDHINLPKYDMGDAPSELPKSSKALGNLLYRTASFIPQTRAITNIMDILGVSPDDEVFETSDGTDVLGTMGLLLNRTKKTPVNNGTLAKQYAEYYNKKLAKIIKPLNAVDVIGDAY